MFSKTIIFILALVVSACSTGESMQVEEPFYKVYVNVTGMKFRAVVNGVAIKNDRSLKPTKVEIPINQWVRTGENKFVLELFPLSKDGSLSRTDDAFAQIEYRLYTSLKEYVVLSSLDYSIENFKNGSATKGSTDAGSYFLKNHKFESDKNGDYQRSSLEVTSLKNNMTFIKQSVTMHTPFPEWAFLNSDLIPERKQFKTKNELIDGLVGAPFKVLQKIHESLSKKDIDIIMPLFKERNDEMDKAYYYKSGTYEGLLREELKKDLNDEDMILRDMKIDVAKPIISPGKQLMELGASPLIRFAEKDESFFNFYDIVFRKKGNDWIITR